MVIKLPHEDIFEESDGHIRISSDAPPELTNAIRDAKNELALDNQWVIRSVGQPRRSLDFGAKNITLIQTNTATVFAKNHEDGQKILAVGVSEGGPLTKEQVREARREFLRDADLTPEEKIQTSKTAKSLDSIRQAEFFVLNNSNETQKSIRELKNLLDSPIKNDEGIIEKSEEVEFHVHNLLSSVYTFTETADETLRALDLLVELKHYIQKYQDAVSTAIGLRHCIQHNVTIRINWIAKYNHNSGDFESSIGIPLKFVKNEEIYGNIVHDATGNKRDPVDYYYGDTDSYLIDIETLAQTVSKETEETYSTLLDEVDIDELEAMRRTRQFFRLGATGIEDASED